MGQSGIALQYAENHDGIEGYFNPRGVEKLQFLGGRPPSPPEQENTGDFEKFGGNGSTKFITGGQDRHRPLKKLLEQLGLDSHFERISP
jgi:hypothetical protein